MMINGTKKYRCEISASGKTMVVNNITNEGLERQKCVLRLSGHGDLVDKYKAVVARRNRHLLETPEEDRDDVWCYDLELINDEYNCTVDRLLKNCSLYRA